MAFNFNWAPLSGDPDFYKRAEELLTDAMNKNEKPPIIVDDIIVTELNLGDIPPDMEVVEISDIGIDRFRGTFKMCYIGNAFITIKTRVQANPLNTYLGTRPSYTSPQPLAAAAGLTIPLQITLSDFKLSAIIILVFSRQKGLTIVFRNDPLESLKVSSTFDSMPFIANYLQQVIEKQLRTLFMDELPAIIHRMSLRLWVPEHRAKEEQALRDDEVAQDEPAVDPLASPPQDPVDSSGTALTPAEVASMTLDSLVDTQSLFSGKNLLRLATLTDSHRTLSLFTPNIRDVVFRAWTGPLERGEMSGQYSKAPTPALSRSHSYSGSISSAYSFDPASLTRPGLHSYNSSFSGRLKSHPTRKRKKRVVNLRKQPETGEIETIIEDGSTITDSASVTESNSDAATAFSAPPVVTTSDAQGILDPVTPPRSPRALRQTNKELADILEMTPTAARSWKPAERPSLETPQSSPNKDENRTSRIRQRRVVNLTNSHGKEGDQDQTPRASMYVSRDAEPIQLRHQHLSEKAAAPSYETGEASALHDTPQLVHSSSSKKSAPSTPPLPNFLSFITDPGNTSSIAERAWMMKMAAELSKRYEEEKSKGSFDIPSGSKSSGSREGRDDDVDAPPAYTY